MKYLSALTFLLGLSFFSSAQPSIEWQKNYGGTGYEIATSVNEILGEGFIILGYTTSTDFDVSTPLGGEDIWVIKTDYYGNILWEKTLGGSSNDGGYSLYLTNDNGFILAGYTFSIDGDITLNLGASDFWLVKFNSAGNIQWQKSYGGSGFEKCRSIQQTFDKGFIFTGESNSVDGNVTGNHGFNDYWVVKVDSLGNIEWEKSLGGSNSDSPSSIIQTVNQDYMVVGTTLSNNGDVIGNHGGFDGWIIKLDSFGNIIWQKTLGGSGSDNLNNIIQTNNNNYLIVGSSSSNDGDVSVNLGQSDFWAIKLDTNGNIIWEKSYGGSDFEVATSVQQTIDGNYLIAGFTKSIDNHVSFNNGDYDFWIIKIDPSGNLLYEMSLGGSASDRANDIKETSTGGIIVAGRSVSNDGNLTSNYYLYDIWVVKLSDPTSIIENKNLLALSLYPNPTSSELNIQFTLTENKNMKLQLYNSLGQVVKTISEEKINAGENIINLSIEHLPSGVYHLQLKVDDNMVTRKVVKF